MNYIYDIVLNFNKDYYEFFQWKKGDKIINVKKIPAFRVSSEDIRILKYNYVKVNREFLDKIYNVTLFYSKNDCKYMCLVSDTNESLGLIFDKEGNLLKRSSLVFDEEEEVNEELGREEEIKIEYVYNKFRDVDYVSRLDKEKREYLYKFINGLDCKKNEIVLKYIYYDYFEKEEDDIFLIKKNIIKEINSDSCDKNRLYDLIKVFKKIKN